MKLSILVAVVAALAIPVAQAGNIEIKTVRANGTTFEYSEQGSGTPVVFVHGAISDLRTWEVFRAPVSKNHRYIAYTRRYFGKQPWSDKGEKFTRRQHAEDLVAFIEAVSKEPVHLFTWSSGGNVGTHATVMRPDLFRSVVHFEPVVTSLYPEIPGMAAARADQFRTVGKAFAALKAGKTDEAGMRFLETVLDMKEGEAKTALTPEAQAIVKDNGRTIPIMMRAKPMASTTCAALGRVKTPTMIMVGGQPKPFFAALAEVQASCQANAVLATIKGTNHGGPHAKTDVIVKRALAFYEMFADQ